MAKCVKCVTCRCAVSQAPARRNARCAAGTGRACPRFSRARFGPDAEMAVIELTAAMPGQGVSSMFSLGHGSCGAIEGTRPRARKRSSSRDAGRMEARGRGFVSRQGPRARNGVVCAAEHGGRMAVREGSRPRLRQAALIGAHGAQGIRMTPTRDDYLRPWRPDHPRRRAVLRPARDDAPAKRHERTGCVFTHQRTSSSRHSTVACGPCRRH